MTDNYVRATKKDSIINYLNKIDGNCLIIYSPTSIKNIDYNFSRFDNFVSTNNITKNVTNIDKYIKEHCEFISSVISIGGGSSIDIGKYISHKIQCKLTVVPTMLSTNAYATSKVALIVNNKKVTIDSKIPDEVILDYTLLKQSLKYNLFGIADILSIHTALNDWSLADSKGIEKINSKIYNMALTLLSKTIDYINNNEYDTFNMNIDELYYAIGEAGNITNLYGSGRPESGSEHILAKAIEGKFNVHHGISVSISIIIMSIIQNNIDNNVYNCFRKIRIIEDIKNSNIKRADLFSILKELKPRQGRYSIVDTFSHDSSYINNVLDKYEKVLNGDIL